MHFSERFGFVSLNNRLSNTERPIVIHCASVGEVLAATPLIKKLLTETPNLPVIITCNTPTGREQILNNFENSVQAFYLPLDFPTATARFLKRVKPQILCILETELWPNLMSQANNKGIPVLVLNARLSKKSQQGYKKVQSLTRTIMDSITTLASHNKQDAERFIELGLPTKKVSVTGSIKFDISPSDEQLQKVVDLKLQYNNSRFIWVAGSTHPIEHELILKAHEALLKEHPDALLVIAPRHPEQFEKVAKLLAQSSLSYSLRSENNYHQQDVLLADTLGELQCLYAMANISYIGGSLIARGGHNPLESAAFSVGVLCGPSTYNFSHIYPELISLGGAIEVANVDELTKQLIIMSNQPSHCKKLGVNAALCVSNNQGAIKRTINIIKQNIKS